jgi:hypothetical protein
LKSLIHVSLFVQTWEHPVGDKAAPATEHRVDKISAKFQPGTGEWIIVILSGSEIRKIE